MVENVSEKESEGWKKFLRKHWTITAIFAVAAVLAVIAQSLSFCGS
jgi:hypothetical protein